MDSIPGVSVCVAALSAWQQMWLMPPCVPLLAADGGIPDVVVAADGGGAGTSDE